MSMIRTCAIVILLSLPMAAAHAYELDPHEHMDRAVELIEAGQFNLARSYLAPVVIHPKITSGERSRAYYLRGFSFVAQGMVVSARKDYNRALEFNPNNPVVLTELGRLHADGLGVEADEAGAFALFEQAAEGGYDRAQFSVGHAYLNGRGVEKNLVLARESFTEAAEQGHTYAMLNLGASYRRPHVLEPQAEEALAWYERARAEGEPNALLSIGFMHANGEFGEPDKAAAATHFQAALDEGSAAAGAHLAYAYLVGDGVPEDHDRAVELYTQAAQAGVVNAFVGLGHVYEHGIGVGQDIETAQEWYEKGAHLNDGEALSRLVSFHLRRDSQASRTEAIKWSKVATQLGTPQAHNDYAWLLATSKADELRNGTLALDQAKRAVSGEPSAQYLDTLAAAHAELGNFDEAIATQREAIALIDVQDEELRSDFERRLQYYERSQPWRE